MFGSTDIKLVNRSINKLSWTTDIDHEFIQARDRALHPGQPRDEDTQPAEQHVKKETGSAQLKHVAHLVPIYASASRLDELPRDINRRRQALLNAVDKVICHDLGRLRQAQLVEKQALHCWLCLLRAREVGSRRAEQVGDVPEQGDVVLDLAALGANSQLGKLQPHGVAAERADRMDTVQRVDGYPKPVDLEIFWMAMGRLEDALADRGMEETHADCGNVTLTTRSDGSKIMGDLKQPLKGLQEPAPEEASGKSASPDQHLDHARRSLHDRQSRISLVASSKGLTNRVLADEALKSKPDDVRYRVAVEESLAARESGLSRPSRGRNGPHPRNASAARLRCGDHGGLQIDRDRGLYSASPLFLQKQLLWRLFWWF